LCTRWTTLALTATDLYQGKLIDDCVICPYHALQFTNDGKRVQNPNGNGSVPGKSSLRIYPVVEVHAMIRVRMGSLTVADESTTPNFSCHTDSELTMVKGSLEIEAYYELVTDNLMDLTHATTVHDGVLGSEAMASGINTVEQDGPTVWSNGWCPDGLAPPAWDVAFDHYGKEADLWTHMRWDARAHMLLQNTDGQTAQKWGVGTRYRHLDPGQRRIDSILFGP
jgi:phenylpropionate dioxygenase-like ring-hydroxylating dioxygenase large terminal subunit